MREPGGPVERDERPADAVDGVRPAAPTSVAAPGPGPAVAPGQPLMAYLPIGLFGSVMGLTGLSVAWHIARTSFGAPPWIDLAIGDLAIAVFVLLVIGYGVKWVAAPKVVRAEYDHPVAGNLFGTFLISVLLLPIVIAPFALLLARAMWAVGVVGILLFSLRMIDRWLQGSQRANATPAWIVPVVGLLDIPLAMPALALPEPHALRMLALAVGLFYAVPLFTVIVARLLFEPPLPPAQQPTLLILLAPSAVGLSTYVITMGRFDAFAECLFAISLFNLFVFGGRLRYLVQCCPFRVGWWAVSFPMAACAIAALRTAEHLASGWSEALAWALLVAATALIAWMFVRTTWGALRGELRALSS